MVVFSDGFLSQGTGFFTVSWKETVFIQSIFTLSCILLPILHLHLAPSPSPRYQHPLRVWAHLDFTLLLSRCLPEWGNSHVVKTRETLQLPPRVIRGGSIGSITCIRIGNTDITLPDHSLFYLPGVFQSCLANYRLSSAVLLCSVPASYRESPLLVICKTAYPFLG